MKLPTKLDMIEYATTLMENSIKADTDANVSVIQDFNNVSIVFTIDNLHLFINKSVDVRKNDAIYGLALEVLDGLSVKDAKKKLSEINRRFV